MLVADTQRTDESLVCTNVSAGGNPMDGSQHPASVGSINHLHVQGCTWAAVGEIWQRGPRKASFRLQTEISLH